MQTESERQNEIQDRGFYAMLRLCRENPEFRAEQLTQLRARHARVTGAEQDAITSIIARIERYECEQGCGNAATVYAIDRAPGGWGGRYCDECAGALGFQTVDRL